MKPTQWCKFKRELNSYFALNGIVMPKRTKPDEPSDCGPTEQAWLKATLVLALKGSALQIVAEGMERGTDILNLIHEKYDTPENKAHTRILTHGKIHNFRFHEGEDIARQMQRFALLIEEYKASDGHIDEGMMTSILVRSLPEHLSSLKAQVIASSLDKMPSFVEFQQTVLTFLSYELEKEKPVSIRSIRTPQASGSTHKRKRDTSDFLYLSQEQYRKYRKDPKLMDEWRRDRHTIQDAQKCPGTPASRKIFAEMNRKYPKLYTDASGMNRARIQGPKQPTLPSTTHSRYNETSDSPEAPESDGESELS